MICDYSHQEPITVKALLIALGVLVITQVGVTIFNLVIFYGLADDHLNGTLVLFSIINGFKYALVTSGAAFLSLLPCLAFVRSCVGGSGPKSSNQTSEVVRQQF
jgi:hypothetical protein